MVAGALVEVDHDYAEGGHADLVVAIAEGNYWVDRYGQDLENCLVALCKVPDYADYIDHLAGPVSAEGLVDHCNHFDVGEEDQNDHLFHHLLGDRCCVSADMGEVVDIRTEDFVGDTLQPVARREEVEEGESYTAAFQPL